MKSKSKEKCVKFSLLCPAHNFFLVPRGRQEKGFYFRKEVQSFVCPKSTNTKMLVKISLFLVVLYVVVCTLYYKQTHIHINICHKKRYADVVAFSCSCHPRILGRCSSMFVCALVRKK